MTRAASSCRSRSARRSAPVVPLHVVVAERVVGRVSRSRTVAVDRAACRSATPSRRGSANGIAGSIAVECAPSYDARSVPSAIAIETSASDERALEEARRVDRLPAAGQRRASPRSCRAPSTRKWPDTVPAYRGSRSQRDVEPSPKRRRLMPSIVAVAGEPQRLLQRVDRSDGAAADRRAEKLRRREGRAPGDERLAEPAVDVVVERQVGSRRAAPGRSPARAADRCRRSSPGSGTENGASMPIDRRPCVVTAAPYAVALGFGDQHLGGRQSDRARCTASAA